MKRRHGPGATGTANGDSKVQISASTATALMKFAWPFGWLVLMSYLSFMALTGSPNLRWGFGVSPVWGKALLLGLLLLGVWFTYRVSMRLKKVWLTADGIRASNYFGEASIMWPHVRRVVIHGAFGQRHTPLVELELRPPHPFGGRISLLPASKHLLAELTGRAAASGVKVEQK